MRFVILIEIESEDTSDLNAGLDATPVISHLGHLFTSVERLQFVLSESPRRSDL